MQDSEGEEGGYDLRGLVRDPEPAESNGQLEAGVEVAEVEDVVRLGEELVDACVYK
jgi:hypothetical protein